MKLVSTHIEKLLPLSLLFLILMVTYGVYSPGLNGGFLFDDYANLETMGTYGGVVDLETFKNFVFNGFSGPLGRPVALASFLIDDYTWPSAAASFKATNLKIHLLTGLLILWSSLHLLRLMGKEENVAIWIALLSTSIWLLHPFLVSTTLYVVQRMAQLATFFVFAGIAAYLYGRLLLGQGKTKAAYLWMSISLPLMTVVAVFSKENGILLPFLIVVIEVCLPSHSPRLNIFWRLIFQGLPCLGLLALLIKEINLAEHPWSTRNFNQIERLLTESRILWEYLYYLFVPQIEGRGLFQDGFVVSKSILKPISTLVSLLGVVCLIVAGIFIRKKYPLCAVAILFFLASHIIESTHLGLELYFEHRNYMGAGLLFLPLAAFIVELRSKVSLKVPIICALCLLIVLSFLTWERAKLWSNTRALERYWAISAVDSPRAQNKLVALYLSDGQREKALELMEKSILRFPQSSLIASNYLYTKIAVGRVREVDFHMIADLMANQSFDAQSIMGINNLTDMVISGKNDQYIHWMINLLKDLELTSKNSKVFQFKKVTLYSLAKLYLVTRDYEYSLNYFLRAVDVHNDMDAGLNMVALMANEGRPVEASIILQKVEEIYRRQNVLLKRSKETYDFEISRIKEILKQDLGAIGISNLIIKQTEKKK